jgi:hypothetical protein
MWLDGYSHRWRIGGKVLRLGELSSHDAEGCAVQIGCAKLESAPTPPRTWREPLPDICSGDVFLNDLNLIHGDGATNAWSVARYVTTTGTAEPEQLVRRVVSTWSPPDGC